MVKKRIFIGILFLVVFNQFASDKSAIGLASTQGEGVHIIMPCTGMLSSRVQKMPLFVTTSDGKEIEFMSSYEYKQIQTNHALEVVSRNHVFKVMAMDQLRASGYRGEAVSPRSAVKEMLARIKLLEEGAVAPVPTSGGASAASEPS